MGRWWDVPGLGRMTVEIPRGEEMLALDRTWPALRPARHANHHWRWTEILGGKREKLAVLDATPRILAAWCSEKHRPLRLPGGAHYRLDYLEIHPALRGGKLSLFTFALIATRALELGCQGLVLGALPEVRRFYQALGGVQGIAPGWQPERALLPFVFHHDTLLRLKEFPDAFLEG